MAKAPLRKSFQKSFQKQHFAVSAVLACMCFLAHAQTNSGAAPVPLPTSKELSAGVPGASTKSNSLPMALAVSPDGRYVAQLNAGYGTYESQYQQSIAVYDTKTGKLTDFPEPRTRQLAPQMLYQGLAFSHDGRHLYASFDSLSAPEGKLVPGTATATSAAAAVSMVGATGNALGVYGFADGVVTPERLIPIPLQSLAQGRRQNLVGAPVPPGMAISSPAGIAVVHDGTRSEKLLVADDMSDDALLMDATTGQVLHRFDLSSGAVVPATYPIAVTVTHDGRRGFVALWNGSAIAELNLRTGAVLHTLPLQPPADVTAAGSHPTAFAWSPDESTLYVALANRDAVAAVRVGQRSLAVTGYFDTRLPGQRYFGAEPNALAVSADGRRMYAANAGTDSVAVFRTAALRRPGAVRATSAGVRAGGFIPTEWLPIGLAVSHGSLFIATGKGKGTGPNGAPQRVVEGDPHTRRPYTYIATMLYGSLASVKMTQVEARLPALTRQAVESNMEQAAQQHIAFRTGANPIKHVIYILKENRTYDQVFGDLPVGNGDKSLTMYGEEVTPNLHKLALQFGVLDNFYDSGEVSGDGHVWSTAAITSDYTEKTWQQTYRGRERNYDYEGTVEEGYPVEERISDVNEPASGYLWTNLARHGKTYYHFGEFIGTRFCGERTPLTRQSPMEGTPEPPPTPCARNFILPGEAIPENYGGGTSAYPWPIPLIAKEIASKPELRDHFDPLFPDFELAFPDQLRVEEFLTRFRPWAEARGRGEDPMPQFVLLRLPNDHTAGTKPGMPRPAASVADNDLAVGRAIDAVSHSPYWDDTAFFILEDDAQAGADHVDAHRSIGLVVSKYGPRAETPNVDHGFFTTVSMIRTMEDLLGLPPMNNNDAFAPPIASPFSGAGDQPAFTADYRNRDNGFIYQANGPQAPGAVDSSRMDFRHEDRADPQKLNVILWRDAMGSRPVPAMLRTPQARGRDTDD